MENSGYHVQLEHSKHVACKYDKTIEVYMIGMDLRSDTKYYNNIYKGTKNYSSTL